VEVISRLFKRGTGLIDQSCGDFPQRMIALRMKKLSFPNLLLHSRIPILLSQMSSKPYAKDSSPRDRRRRNNPHDSPSVALSKQLSWLLRHGLDKSGLPVRNDGYVQLDALVPSFTTS